MLVPTGYAPFEISFIAMDDKVDTSLFSENGAWELMDTHVSAGVANQNFQYLIATFHIKRRASFYLVNMLLPISIMGVLNLLVFFLPAESGERVSYSMTLLLAIAVFLTIAADHLPKTSFPTISVLSIKLLVDMMISGLALFFTVVGLHFYHADEEIPVPGWIAAMTKVLLCTRCCKRRKKEKYRIREINHGTEGKPLGCKNNTDYEINKQPCDINNTDIEAINLGLHTNDLSVYKDGPLPSTELDEDENGPGNTDVETITWNEVGKASDVLFFCLTLVAFVASHIVYLIYSLWGNKPSQN